MVDDALDGIFKMPKYLPPDYMIDFDAASSPKKSFRSADEELKVYDHSQSMDSSSIIKTDESMKDYDYMIEPEIQFNQFYSKNNRKQEHDSVSIGDGLGVLTRFKG